MRTILHCRASPDIRLSSKEMIEPARGPLLALLACLALAPARSQEDELAAKSQAAKQAMGAGRYLEAVKIYRELAHVLPENSGLRLNLGLALEKAGKPAEAIPELTQAARTQPDLAAAWFLLGLAYQQLGKPREAIAPLEKAVSLDRSNTQAQLELADAELAAGQPRDATEAFGAIARSHPEMAKAWQGLGLSYLALSERAYRRLGEVAPNSGFWNALLARSRAAEGRFAESLNLYQRSGVALPSLPGIHAARAEVYRQAGRQDWAAIEEERETKIAKPNCAARPAACAYLAGDWRSALAQSQKVATPENLYWASLACDRLAMESFEGIAALPPSPESHELLAEANRRMGRREEAVEEWRKALALAPGERRVQGRLGDALIRDRKYDEATRVLAALVDAQPENSEWQYLLGEALYEQRQADAALPHLIAAERLAPSHLPTAETLGRVYLALGQPEKAITRLEKARPLDDGAISFALNSAYRRLGREAEAAAALARYQQLTRQRGGSAPSRPESDTIPAP
jgi:tetratricopeptide (TPR) repeat protein